MAIISFNPSNDPLETDTILQRKNRPIEVKSLLTITHKGNRELGNSDPSLLELKSFALSYNSTLPLYPNHTENQNKGIK